MGGEQLIKMNFALLIGRVLDLQKLCLAPSEHYFKETKVIQMEWQTLQLFPNHLPVEEKERGLHY